MCAVCDQEKFTNAAVRRRVCRIGCITRAPRGAALAVFFSFCVRLFLAARVSLGFFHSEALHVRAQVSDSRRASPTRRVRIFCIRPAWRVFGGRIRERGSPRLGAKRAPTHTGCGRSGASANAPCNMRKWSRPRPNGAKLNECNSSVVNAHSVIQTMVFVHGSVEI